MMGIVAEVGRTQYMDMLEVQRRLNRARNEHRIPDVVIFNEHDPVYTVGIHRNPSEIVDSSITPVQIERGGSVTYHGPGQIIVYFILNLMERRTNIKEVIQVVQTSIVDLLKLYGINAEGRLDKETGVWVSEKKICSIGFAIKESSTLHGVALNVSTDLGAFNRIMPCGFSSSIMTSIEHEVGKRHDFSEVQKLFRNILTENLGFSEISEIKNFESLKRLV